MVEGFASALEEDQLKHTIEILQNLLCRYSDCPDASFSEPDEDAATA
jgi:hypothetical protein